MLLPLRKPLLVALGKRRLMPPRAARAMQKSGQLSPLQAALAVLAVSPMGGVALLVLQLVALVICRPQRVRRGRCLQRWLP